MEGRAVKWLFPHPQPREPAGKAPAPHQPLVFEGQGKEGMHAPARHRPHSKHLHGEAFAGGLFYPTCSPVSWAGKVPGSSPLPAAGLPRLWAGGEAPLWGFLKQTPAGGEGSVLG